MAVEIELGAFWQWKFGVGGAAPAGSDLDAVCCPAAPGQWATTADKKTIADCMLAEPDARCALWNRNNKLVVDTPLDKMSMGPFRDLGSHLSKMGIKDSYDRRLNGYHAYPVSDVRQREVTPWAGEFQAALVAAGVRTIFHGEGK